MKNNQRLALWCIVAVLMYAKSTTAEDLSIPEIHVTPDSFQSPSSLHYNWRAPNAGVPADSGDALRQIPGISGVRMGGHGIDPVIRGQGASRVNIVLDGANIQGGCPNRMDPPTAYAPLASYDEIEVIKGGHSVRYGSGASGGVVLFRRSKDFLRPDKAYRASIESGYHSNADQQSYDLDLTAGSNTHYLRAAASIDRAHSYTDGSNQKVRSAFETRAASLALAALLAKQWHIDASWEHNEADDLEFAGARMDSPATENRMLRTQVSWTPDSTLVSAINFRAYRSIVDHLMDNHSLRTVSNGTPFLTADSDSKTLGGAIEVALATDTTNIFLGTDARSTEQTASRLAGKSAGQVSNLQSVLWPDVSINRWGVFLEAQSELNEILKLENGVRVDSVYSNSRAANRKPAAEFPTPNQLYQQYYGVSAESKHEENISGFSKLVGTIAKNRNQKLNGYLVVSRSLRTADATERYIASMSAKAPMRWVGNPQLDPEQHHQIEIGLFGRSATTRVSLALFHNSVDDFILRDRARKQTGIQQEDLASVYRNVRAKLMGGEFDSAVLLSPAWQMRLGLAYTWANNESDDRPIAQIPPLQGTASLEYIATNWRLGSQLRFATKQSRVDDNPLTGSSLDAKETPGYATVNLFGELSLTQEIHLQLGIDNLLDKTYAEHLNKPNTLDTNILQINEPGISAWIKFVAQI